jgi:hypothetical protein
MGASLDVFTNGDLGIGWAKSVYGDAKKAMYSYDNSLQKFDDGSTALCNSERLYSV